MEITKYKYYDKIGTVYKKEPKEVCFLIKKENYSSPYYQSFIRFFELTTPIDEYINYEFQILIFTSHRMVGDNKTTYYSTQVGFNTMESLDRYVGFDLYKRTQFLLGREVCYSVDREIINTLLLTFPRPTV